LCVNDTEKLTKKTMRNLAETEREIRLYNKKYCCVSICVQ
jgi:hypothetical protein